MDHEAKIKDQDSWGFWPFLCMKRGDSDIRNKNLGVLIADPEYLSAIKGKGGPIAVYHANIYKLPESFEDTAKTEYPSIQAMLADGWVVD